MIKQEVEHLVECLCQEYLQPRNIVYRIEFTNNGVKYLGKCIRKKYSTYFTLRFSTLHLNRLYEDLDIDQIKDTVLHEIAHAIVYHDTGVNHGHDWLWKRVAKNIGGTGEVTANLTFKTGRYVYECPHCHRQIARRRKINRGLACGVCCEKYNNGKYNENYNFVLIEDFGKNTVIEKSNLAKSCIV